MPTIIVKTKIIIPLLDITEQIETFSHLRNDYKALANPCKGWAKRKKSPLAKVTTLVNKFNASVATYPIVFHSTLISLSPKHGNIREIMSSIILTYNFLESSELTDFLSTHSVEANIFTMSDDIEQSFNDFCNKEVQVVDEKRLLHLLSYQI